MIGNRLNAALAVCLGFAVCALAVMVVRDLDQATLDRASTSHALLRERAAADWLAGELVTVERLAMPGAAVAGELRPLPEARRRLDSLATGGDERAALADLDERRRRLLAARDAVNLAERLNVEGEARARAGLALAAAARDYREAARGFVNERRADSDAREFQRGSRREAGADWLRIALAALLAGVAWLGWRASVVRDTGEAAGPRSAEARRVARVREAMMAAGRSESTGVEEASGVLDTAPASADGFDENLRALRAAVRAKADIIDVEAREPARN